jgi:serine/threonine protein kinase
MSPSAPSGRLGPYELIEFIGRGGMGEVWKARDTRLNRVVALKISKTEFTQRFEREAMAIAALNHPNICHLYDVGSNYLVMEYVQGAELRGPIPVSRAVELACQILDSLDAAHRKGIVHRDLKPGNILVTKPGVKVLDFGLAKMQTQAAVVGADTPTAITVEGSISGTLQYMAPEQLQGKSDVDSRADIFAFGCVLYEILTGKRAFDGSNAASVIAAVMERPAPSAGDVPPALDRVLKRCLEKDPDERWQTARDLKWELIRAVEPALPTSTDVRVPSRARALLPAIVAALIFAATVIAFVGFRQASPESPVVNTSVLPPDGTIFDFTSGENPPALSPDGEWLVFGARSADGRTQLWVRPLNSATAHPLQGTAEARFPFWSPDSRSVAFFADGKLKRTEISGGVPLTLADAPRPTGGSWGAQGTIVFAPERQGPLQRIASSGGNASPLTSTDNVGPNVSRRFPWFLPDGRHFLFEEVRLGRMRAGVVRAGSLDSGENKTLSGANSSAIYASGYLLFLQGSTLVARRFDPKSVVASGDVVPIEEHIGTVFGGSISQSNSAAILTASNTGVILYQTRTDSGSWQLAWFDRSGKKSGVLGEPGEYSAVEFSPDRKRVAVALGEKAPSQGTSDIWTYDIARGLRNRLTSNHRRNLEPSWSPDGRTIAFSSAAAEYDDLYTIPADGSGVETLRYADNSEKRNPVWSPDGRFLLYTSMYPETSESIRVLPLTPSKKPFPFSSVTSREGQARPSPDDRWVAWTSLESQQPEVYVAPFPGAGNKRQISAGGGSYPRWRQDGKEIFYVGPDNRLMATEIEIKGGAIEVVKVQSLGIPVTIGRWYMYDVSADGQKFLVAAQPDEKRRDPLTLVQNWTAGLK